jgi:hypothetical protein
VKRFFCALTAGIVVCCAPALAWGTKGHTIINHLAAQGFEGRMPAFLTTRSAIYEIGFLGPQLDDLKDAGESWDADFDPGHYVDLLEDGTIAGVVRIENLPENREAYDTALRAAGTDQYRQGYLPYSILDGWEQLRKDFAYWRVDDYVAGHAPAPAARASAARERDIEQTLVVRDLGVWAHFVGDASQPLHVTVHYNGWGAYPNPNGYTESRSTHAAFESDFVNRYVNEAQVAKLMQTGSALPVPSSLLLQQTVMNAISRYLLETNRTVSRLYDIEKAGGFASGSPQAVSFTAARLAAGAVELRDLSVWAWQDSLNESVGYPGERVRDILSGTAPWPQRSGS